MSPISGAPVGYPSVIHGADVCGRGRQLLWIAVTRNPTAEWLARQITEAFPWDSAPKYLVRDNDRAIGAAFKAPVRAMGIRDRPTSFRSPLQNGYVERLIGSIRHECLDHLMAADNNDPHKIGRREPRAEYLGWLHCRQINEIVDHCAWMSSQADSRVAYPGRTLVFLANCYTRNRVIQHSFCAARPCSRPRAL